MFCPGKILCRYGCIYFLTALVLVFVDVMFSAYDRSWPGVAILTYPYPVYPPV